jgi:cytochrome P450
MQVIARSHIALAVVQEVMRLYPPVSVNFRRATKDTHVANVDVPVDTVVYLNWKRAIRATGPGGDTFNPSHWLSRNGGGSGDEINGTTGCKVNTQTGNFVFGAGPRVCVGQSLATVEATVLTAALAREVKEIRMDEAEAAVPFFSPVFGHPTDMPLTLVPRNGALAA